MRFDRFDDTAAESGVIPDGTHECEIAKVKTVTTQRDGREKLVLTLRDSDGRWGQIEKWLDPSEKRDHRNAMELLDALGMSRDADLDDSIVGRRVKVVTKRAVKDGEPVLDAQGRQRVYVNAFAASAAPAWEQASPAEDRKPAKRTATQKADAASGASGDDIPF